MTDCNIDDINREEELMECLQEEYNELIILTDFLRPENRRLLLMDAYSALTSATGNYDSSCRVDSIQDEYDLKSCADSSLSIVINSGSKSTLKRAYKTLSSVKDRYRKMMKLDGLNRPKYSII